MIVKKGVRRDGVYSLFRVAFFPDFYRARFVITFRGEKSNKGDDTGNMKAGYRHRANNTIDATQSKPILRPNLKPR